MEVALSLQNLASAASKTKDSAIQKRITELKAYVHYLKLYYDYQYSPSVIKYSDLINYIYSIHQFRLLQTSALLTSYIKKPTGFSEEKHSKVNAIIINGMEENFKKDLQENPGSYSISDFNFDISKASPAENKEKKKYNPSYINGNNKYEFYLATSKNVVFQAGATANTQFTIKDERDKVWFDKTIIGSKQGYEIINLELPKGKYTLSFGDYNRFSRIVLPQDIAFFSSNNFYDNAGYPLLYIYVPKDMTEIIYSDKLGPGINKRGNWKNPDGETIKPVQLKYDAYRVKVAPPIVEKSGC